MGVFIIFKYWIISRITVPLPSKTEKMLSLGKMRARSLLLSLNRIIAAQFETLSHLR